LASELCEQLGSCSESITTEVSLFFFILLQGCEWKEAT